MVITTLWVCVTIVADDKLCQGLRGGLSIAPPPATWIIAILRIFFEFFFITIGRALRYYKFCTRTVVFLFAKRWRFFYQTRFIMIIRGVTKVILYIYVVIRNIIRSNNNNNNSNRTDLRVTDIAILFIFRFWFFYNAAIIIFYLLFGI